MKLTKKNKIVLITLAVVLVALLIVYFTAIAPLLEKEPVVYPIPLDGEGLVGTKLTIYKSIEKEDLVSIKISNEHGNYTFNNVKDEKGNYIGKLKGYEMLEFDEIYYAYLLSFALDPIMVDNEPYRNKIDENGNKIPLTEEDMAKYGVTEDTCSVTMTVTYKDNGVEKTHVLRIGYESFTTNPTYYVAYEGRNTVYRFSGGISCAELNIADYLTPVIFQGYGSVSEAALNIIQFSINSFDKKTGDFKNLVFITGEQYTGGETLSITHTYHVMGYDANGKYTSLKNTEAERSYVNAAMSIFYTSFYGDKVVAIDPDEELLKKYGLGPEDTIYLISASNSENDDKKTPEFAISRPIYDEKEKATFHYTTVEKEGGVTIVVRIPESVFVPKNQYKDVESSVFDETRLINWASTNTTASGFNQAILPIEGFAGVKEITIKVPTSVYQHGGETFYIEHVKNSAGENILHVTTASGRYEDKGPNHPKPFNSFFRVLITYPDAVRFNSFSDAEIEQYATDANLIYYIEAVTNDNKIERYEYYRISSEYVMVCITRGSIKNGQREMGARKCIYDSTRAQIQDAIHVAFLQLLNGEEIKVK